MDTNNQLTKDVNVETAPLEQLLTALTDAKLDKREDDIAHLQDEIGKRQAAGETVPARDLAEVAKKAF